MAESVVSEDWQFWFPVQPTEGDRQNPVHGQSYDRVTYGELQLKCHIFPCFNQEIILLYCELSRLMHDVGGLIAMY